MPVPKPSEKETETEFLRRCMNDKTMKKEYEQKQRLAICFDSFRKAKGGEK